MASKIYAFVKNMNITKLKTMLKTGKVGNQVVSVNSWEIFLTVLLKFDNILSQ